MKSKYEISIWEDVPSEDGASFVEKKIIVIGSNTMTSESRAREPKLVNNINGTNKFTFNMYYSYIDTRTGEKVYNPYIKYLVNERKIKVLWKDQWYDLLIKQIKEDQVNHIFTYTCEDAYITELSRTGFELVFSTELQNNIGTAPELLESVLEGTDWRVDGERMEKIYQKTEEAVYEATTRKAFTAICDVDGNETNIEQTIEANKPILIYYSSAPSVDNLKDTIQFCYAGEGFKTDVNDMLVINGTSYTVDVTWDVEDKIATAKINNTPIFNINFSVGLSQEYRAERYVQSQKTKYIDLIERYVNVYKDEDDNIIYGYQKTEYDDALAVVNLVTNPSNFANSSGWIGKEISFKLSPTFNKDTIVENYKATSFLYLKPDTYFNTGIQNNRAYISNGFIENDVYIFRVKARVANGDKEAVDCDWVRSSGIIIPSIQGRDSDYKPLIPQYFNIGDPTPVEEEDGSVWLEFECTCIKPCSYDKILDSYNPFGIFLKVTSNIWLEEAQFFHKVMGTTSYETEEKVRINPGQMSLQSVANVTWKYFSDEDLEFATSKDDLAYHYYDNLMPVNNDYERYGTIEADDSNRFNILQTIAESFKCWVRFAVEHDQETGYIKYDNDGPQKYVYLTRETGQVTGIGFIYGIDLKSIVRNIKSDKISTKTIVSQNENQFGKNGFCTIARSEENYPKDNFILNFDYYIQQGLLNRNQLYKDLYNIEDGIGYYTQLHEYNSTYADNLEKLLNKNIELTKQEAMLKVYEQYISASKQELNDVEDSLMKLASVDNMAAALDYAKSHANFTKIQALINDRTQINNIIQTYDSLYESTKESVDALNTFIDETNTAQENIITVLKKLNSIFFKKYSRYIQEGTWTSQDYWDDTLYYLDAVQVAYTSSRPQISYEINVLRLSDIPEYSSKIFNLGDISFIQDKEYFGYMEDKITPYKEKVILTEITSYFDTPDKDTIKVQNYKTQFDDLFQRITAAVQNLEFTEGKYAKAANIINSDGTIKSNVIQNTFSDNISLVYGAQNESANIDNTGITVTNNADGAKQVKVTSGGVFITSDGGATWNNAIRGDGITADAVTTGRLNTEQVVIYGTDAPSFVWDQYGISAYMLKNEQTNYDQFVRFDKYGIYGIKGRANYQPHSEQEIYKDANFGLTWNRFFMKSSYENGGVTRSVEISSDSDIVIKEGENIRVAIGRIDPNDPSNYGMLIRGKNAKDEMIDVFRCDKDYSYLSGWQLDEDCLTSTSINQQSIKIYADGNIGCYATEAINEKEDAYVVGVMSSFTATGLDDGNTGEKEFHPGNIIYPFVSVIGKTKTQRQVEGKDNEIYHIPEPQYIPEPPKDIYFVAKEGINELNYTTTVSWEANLVKCDAEETTVEKQTFTTYTYIFQFTAYIDEREIFTVPSEDTESVRRYIPAADTKWCIDNKGYAIFHDIHADGGQIAGWWLDTQSIYQTYDGTPNKTRIVGGQIVSNIKTELSSTGTANKDNFDYSIVTDAINAAIANIGGVLMSGGLINGYSIAAIAREANNAAIAAQNAQNTANTARNAAQEALTRANNHTHGPGSYFASTGPGGISYLVYGSSGNPN